MNAYLLKLIRNIPHHRHDIIRLKSSKSKRYSDTLNLPRTEFPLTLKSGSALKRELEIQEIISSEKLYQWQLENNPGDQFILHDGPPYANGSPHVGHAINKILKDVTNRYKVMRGHKVHYVAGWDCHGLPIELKALAASKQKRSLTPLQIRDMARKYAREAIKTQMSAFKQWGVMADWDKSYYTYDVEYQTRQLDVFYKLYDKGLVYRDFMPVYWSPSSESALAESELEYNDQHCSNSVYVRFPVTQPSPALCDLTDVGNKKLYAVIWTTTPWSLPANQAIAYSPHIKYAILEEDGSDCCYICEKTFVEKLQSIMQKELKIITELEGSSLSGTRYQHVLNKEELPFLEGGHVETDKGTGLVHTAPAHGHDDFRLAVKHNIVIKNLLDDSGSYTKAAGPQLAYKEVSKGADDTVIHLLGDNVLHREDFIHSYPYDWRTKKPVIIRASLQWFFDLNKLKNRALESLELIEIVPKHYGKGMLAQVETRPYWCISRQRVWGLPIPVFYHKQTRETLVNRHTITHIKDLVTQHGADCWWNLDQSELLPDHLLQKCNGGTCDEYEKGSDILDIWFDSGSSWYCVLPESSQQADVYLEGHDQFGGWFLSSLLTSVALQDKPPYKKLIVHGFTVDEKGKKMSKSVGNVVDPQTVIHGGKNKQKEPSFGVDLLRWWAARNYQDQQIMIGPEILNRFNEDIFKVRKIMRYLLGNLFDFHPDKCLHYMQLWPQDKYMLHLIYQFGQKVTDFYDSCNYGRVLLETEKFINVDVSPFYCLITKDRCYASNKDSEARRASQTVQYHLLQVLTKILAPIVPHLSEEIFQHSPWYHDSQMSSVFKTGWLELKPEWNKPDITHKIDVVRYLVRELGHVICSEEPVEFDVVIYAGDQLYQQLKELQSETTSSNSALTEMMQTSFTSLTNRPLIVLPDDAQTRSGVVEIETKDGGTLSQQYALVVTDASQNMCERCRRFTAESANGPCQRCLDAMSEGWS